MSNTAALVLTGLVLVATLGPCSAQGFFKPKGTPGAYAVPKEPIWDYLPRYNYTKGTKPPKVLLPPVEVPGLNGTKPNLNDLFGNLSTCVTLQNFVNRIPNLNGIMLVGECPIDETHTNCAQCQISLTMMYSSQCISCNSPFVLDGNTKLCGCPVGFQNGVDPASGTNTCLQQGK